jgi:hypothetical protein
MAARKGSASRARSDRHRDNWSAPTEEAATPEHVREFQRGLFPILIAGDVDAFRRYLTRWEEVIGDTAELGELPVEEQRSLMARLLRRPQVYNLPAWPPDLADAGAPPGSRPVDDRPDRDHVPCDAVVPPGLVPRPEVPSDTSAAAVAPPVLEQPNTPAAPEPRSDQPIYQLDMVTGEFVPVTAEAMRVAEPTASFDSEPARPARKRPRRRRLPANLVQLALWPEG